MYKILESHLSFGVAFDTMKASPIELGMRLPKWSPDVVVKIQVPSKESKMTAPYLYVKSGNGMVPWIQTMVELFAETWEIVECLG